jgi:SAM-dependent methyltransferase
MLEVYRSGEYYEGGEAGYGSYRLQEAALRATFRRVVRNLVARGFAGGDLLEIGSGFGFFLDEARTAFRSVCGTEMSEGAAATARGLGFPVVTGGLDALGPGTKFDCVFSGHVIEHIYEPATFMRELCARLRPGGTLVLGTPDASSAWRRLLGSRWPSYKIPEHVVFYDRATLGRLLRQAGLVDIRAFPYAHAFPSALIAERAGLGWLLQRAERLRERPVWLPATTVAVSGRRPLEVGDGG